MSQLSHGSWGIFDELHLFHFMSRNSKTNLNFWADLFLLLEMWSSDMSGARDDTASKKPTHNKSQVKNIFNRFSKFKGQHVRWPVNWDITVILLIAIGYLL